MQDYLQKENYVTRNPSPNDWRYHPNYSILELHQQLITGKVCADFGCNHGSCTILMQDFKPASTDAYDINQNALEVAVKTAEQHETHISFIHANLMELPCADNKYEFAVSFHTLEHIYPEHAPQVVKEIYRVLKKDGYFLISIPYDHHYPDRCHVAFYKEDSLMQLFESNKFKTIECIKDDRWSEKGLLTAVFQK